MLRIRAMKALVFGQTGQVALELARRCPADVEAVFLDRAAADLSDPAQCAEIVATCEADVILNAAAYTAVDRAEEEEAQALCVNGTSPTAMAEAAARRGLPLLHVSTDYVFDGSGTMPWHPDQPLSPLNAYGRSKAAGEAGLRRAGGRAAILRTSWVFSAYGANFVKTMLRLAKTRDVLSVVDDQIGGPTAAGDIADTLWRMAAGYVANPDRPGGIYHFSGAPDVSWAAFAREIFAQVGCETVVQGIPGADYPTAAARPGNSRLDCTGLAADFGIARPDWRRSLTHVLNDLRGGMT
nr:dTDP-4-dehydrorhamnose reductase [Thalassococcus sp. S3]